MKAFKSLLIAAAMLPGTIALGQHAGTSFTLNQPITGGQHSYTATDFVKLMPGFRYLPQGSADYFKGNIGEYISQEVTPPTAGTTGGLVGLVDANGVVGATAGSFAVSETGQATYSIPLEFPGGIGGMTPDLSLIYNSNGGDGILGPGWSLGGLSVINLVPANRYYDGIKDAAYGGDYLKDAYTLDGQRLIIVQELNNDHLIFRTEHDGFSKILRKNVTKSDEKDQLSYYFEVKTKSGLTYFYGEIGRDDSRLGHKIGNSTHTLAYYVNRIVDNYGNEISFTYRSTVGDAANNTPGDIYIDYIEYTKNGDAQQPMYHIKFNYTERHSPQLTYYNYQPALSQAQTLTFKTDDLIKDIECIYIPNNSVVKRYELEYIDRGLGTETTSKTKHLVSLQEFGLNGEEEYNKTMFEWEEEMDYSTFTSSIINLPPTFFQEEVVVTSDSVCESQNGSLIMHKTIVRKVRYQFADITNNQRNELIRTYEVYKIDFNNCFFTTPLYKRERKVVIEAFEISQNNVATLLQFYVLNTNTEYGLYNTSSTFNVDEDKSDYQFMIADFTGDGFIDALFASMVREDNQFPYITDVKLYFNNQTGFQFNAPQTIHDGMEVSHSLYVGDFNGDGISDLLTMDNTTTTNHLNWKLGSPLPHLTLRNNVDQQNGQTLEYNPQNNNFQGQITTLDLNGDGRTDFFMKQGNNHKAGLILPVSNTSTQTKLEPETLIGIPTVNYALCYINNDRKSDLLTWEKNDVINGLNVSVEVDFITLFGTGKDFANPGHTFGFEENIVYTKPFIQIFELYSHIDLITTDFNGDGRSDFLLTITSYIGGFIDNGGVSYDDYETIEKRIIIYPAVDGSSAALFRLGNNTFSSAYTYFPVDYAGNNQTDLYRILKHSNNADIIQITKPSPHGSRINRITNGLGAVTKIEYAYSSDPDVYSPGADVDYPVIPYEANQVLVKRVERDNGQNGFFIEQYHYEKARAHTEGLGYLGFEKTIRTDVTRGIRHTTEYDLDTYYYYTYPKKITVSTTGGSIIKETENSYAHRVTQALNGKSVYSVHPDSSTTKHYELGLSTPFKGERITYTGFDDYGNPGTVKTEYGEVVAGQLYYNYSTQVGHVYEPPNEEDWILGRLKTATTTFKAPGKPDIVRKAGFEYYTSGNEKGMLKKEITEPDINPFMVEKAYTYDDFGNILTTTIHAPSLTNQQDRATTTAYKDGRFVETITNPLGHTITRNYEKMRGVLLDETNANGLTSTIEYDAFARPLKTIAPDGNQTASVLRWVVDGDPFAPPNAIYYTWSQSSGSAPMRVYYNKLGMELSSVTIDFNGDAVFVKTIYNNKGQVLSKSEPYKAGGIQLTIFEYDDFGRVSKIVYPDNSQTLWVFNGLTTTSTNALGQSNSNTTNASGWLIASADANGGKVLHTHYANGQVESTHVLGHNNTKRKYDYDFVGNLHRYSDASQDTLTYQYNPFGELAQSTSPMGTTTYPVYDKLGRLRKRISPEGITTWEYDRTGEKGLLWEEKMLADGIVRHKMTYTYNHDNVLRLQSVEETIDTESFTKSLEYDMIGRPSQQTFPSGYAVNYTYNTQGYPNKIVEAGSGTTLWEAKDMNERNQFTHIKLGQNINQLLEYYQPTGRIKKISAGNLQTNNYSWDMIGNLKNRQSRHGIVESFHYDALNRLLNIQHNGIGKTNHQYDALGNITYKSDVGNYQYGNTANPYELTSIDNRPSTINADNQIIGYNSLNKVSKITEKDPATQAILRQLDLVYGIGNQRIMQQMQIGQSLTTKFYVGGDYEVEDHAGEITRVHYIFAPSGLAAIVKRNAQNNNVLSFVLNDHLGSMQVLTDAAGQLLEEFSYDPWGLRRNPITLEVYAWAQMPVTGMDYGFTGHEHLDVFMLVNMNGRMYDPVLGRFLSPDPVLQFPNFTQGLNPYAYALNNPLRFVDPNGYSLVGQLFALTAQLAFTAVGLPMVGVLAYSVIMTIDHAIENGRNVRAGDLYRYFMQTFVMSTISIGATKIIGEYFHITQIKNAIELKRALVHATFNGAMRFAQGGKFEHGFLSGFVSSLGGTAINNPNMSIGARVALSAVIGGTAEKLGGGKPARRSLCGGGFANGAVTGAYVMMFNHLMQQMDGKNQRKVDWKKTSDAEKIQILLIAAKKSGYIVDLNEYFTNIKLTKESYSLLETSLGGNGLKTDKPIKIVLEEQHFDVLFNLAIPTDKYGNINNSIVDLGIQWTVSYANFSKFGPGQPFPGTTKFFRLVVYGSEVNAQKFWNWYME